MPHRSKLMASVAEEPSEATDDRVLPRFTPEGAGHPHDPRPVAAAAGQYVKALDEPLKPRKHGEPAQARGPPAESLAYTIEQFAAAHGFSPAFYYVLKQRGLGPDEMILGRRRLISREAAAAWRAERTKASNPKAEEILP